MSPPRRSLRALCATVLLATVGTTAAAAPQDIMLVLDNSGSMKKNDPEFLTVPAVRAFLGKLGPDTHAGLVVFDQDVRVPVPLTRLDDEARRALLGSLDGIDYRGLLTDSPAALERAVDELEGRGRANAHRSIIFLTDGIVDTGDAARDVDETRWLREELSARATEADIRIFAIAFTDNADFLLIQSLARRTDGAYFRALGPSDIEGVFDRIVTHLDAGATDAAPPRAPDPEPAPATPGLAETAEAPAPSTPALPESTDVTPPPSAPALTETAAVPEPSAPALPESTDVTPPPSAPALTETAAVPEPSAPALPESTDVTPPPSAPALTETAAVPEPSAPALAESPEGPEPSAPAVAQAPEIPEPTAPPLPETDAIPDPSTPTLPEVDTGSEPDGPALPDAPSSEAASESPGAPLPPLPDIEESAPELPPLPAEDAESPALPALSETEPDASATAPPEPSPEAAPDPAPEASSASEPHPAEETAAPAPRPSVTEDTTVLPVSLPILAVGLAAVLALVAGVAWLVARRRARREPPKPEMPKAFLNDLGGVTAHSSYELTTPLTFIGRLQGRDQPDTAWIVIDESTIGRRHALVEYKEHSFWVSDQNSLNGTFVNNRRVEGETRLKHGDRLRFHKFEFEFLVLEMFETDRTMMSETRFAELAGSVEDEEEDEVTRQRV